MKASVFCGISVDGFLARRDGRLDFLPSEPEPHGYEEFIATVDALVMGRNTYEIVLGFGGAWPFEKPVFVLSSHEIAPPPDGAKVEHLSGDPHDIAAEMDARGIERVYVDGGITIQFFLSAGLVDRLIITRVPILIGDGIPLFGSLPHDVRLEHVRTQHYPSGLVQTEYKITS
ncbi:MAG TPA: dihydrofolate reductase family protein [Pyrinomonadaceae bacterium]|nr:dihydrofolate reductase family protein [Pyrinomonadaceae bacterium]